MISFAALHYSPQALFTIGCSLMILMAVVMGVAMGDERRAEPEPIDHEADRAIVIAALAEQPE